MKTKVHEMKMEGMFEVKTSGQRELLPSISHREDSVTKIKNTVFQSLYSHTVFSIRLRIIITATITITILMLILKLTIKIGRN